MLMNKKILNTTSDLLYLVKCVLNGNKADKNLINTELKNIYLIAKAHNLSAIVAYAFSDMDTQDFAPEEQKVISAFMDEKNKAKRNMVLFELERNALTDFFEEQGILYMLMKGVLISKLYPKAFMRQMVDNDIWFDIAYGEKVIEWFKNREYNCKVEDTTIHYTFTKAPVLNFELHYAPLFAKFWNNTFHEYYKEKFENLIANHKEGCALKFSDEDFFVYIFAHAYKHYSNRGTGLRTLVDIYLLNKEYSKKINMEYVNQQFEILGITEFANDIINLTHTIFQGNGNLNNKQKNILSFVSVSNAYGNSYSMELNKIKKVTNSSAKINIFVKIKYILKRIFPSVKNLDIKYKNEKKYKIPIIYICRFVRGFGRGLKELKSIIKIK